MQYAIEFLKTDNFLVILSVFVLLLIIGFLILLVINIEEDLENYMYRVERVEKQNAEITGFCKNLDEDMAKCIQKVGIVRYNAYKDTGSDLSFTVALLDEKNDGIVFNGIYSREISNIYAKPVIGGKSEYTLTEEEKNAILRAEKEEKLS